MISTTINGCDSQHNNFTDVKCLEYIGMLYYRNDISIDNIYDYCPIELSDKKYYFSQIVNGGKSKAEVLSGDTKSTCMNKWNSMLSRAWSVSQEEISKNTSLQTDTAQSNLILSAIFEGNLSTEALNDYTGFINTDADSPQCISPYNAVNIARELGIVKLLSLDAIFFTDENLLTRNELWAAWLIVLHADIHQDIQERFEPIFTKTAQADRISGYNVAMLSDRISIEKMEPLKYGVLYECVEGEISHSLEDLDTVNSRRKAINMKPYEDWLAEEMLKAKCD